MPPHERFHPLRAAALLWRLGARTYGAPPDAAFYLALRGLAQAPGLRAKGLTPLEPHLLEAPSEEAVQALLAEYHRLFGHVASECGDPFGVSETLTSLAGAFDMAAAQPNAHVADTASTLLASVRPTMAGFLALVQQHAQLALYRNVSRMTSDLLADPSIDALLREETTVLTIYSTSTCGYCRQLKNSLDREHIQYADISIDNDPLAASYVESVNGGNQVVPTVVCPNGTVMTNPTVAQIRECMAGVPAWQGTVGLGEFHR